MSRGKWMQCLPYIQEIRDSNFGHASLLTSPPGEETNVNPCFTFTLLCLSTKRTSLPEVNSHCRHRDMCGYCYYRSMRIFNEEELDTMSISSSLF